MHLFAERSLQDFLESKLQLIELEIGREPREQILGVSGDEYVAYLVATYTVPTPELLVDRVYVTHGEKMIPAKEHPQDVYEYDFRAGRNESFKRHTVTYHLPVAGPVEFLEFCPSHNSGWTREVAVENGALALEIVNWRGRLHEVKGEWERFLSKVQDHTERLNGEIRTFNDSLPDAARAVFARRKRELRGQDELLGSLGVPIVCSDSVPGAFRIPVRTVESLVKKPDPGIGAIENEYVLDESVYQHILSICRDLGRAMERHPSIYSDKDEEALRDLFLMMLAPHFHTATGETFNKSGKTDILIRYAGANVFVAECKFWGGAVAHRETLDQILSYLTWRDSKAAVLCFVTRKEIDPILSKLRDATSAHESFASDLGQVEDGWYRYELRLPGDPNRLLQMAVLCFHLPPKERPEDA